MLPLGKNEDSGWNPVTNNKTGHWLRDAVKNYFADFFLERDPTAKIFLSPKPHNFDSNAVW